MKPDEDKKKPGRPEVIPAEAKWKLRVCYVKHYKQWGPAVLAAWARREGLGNWHPDTIARVIKDLVDEKDKKTSVQRYEIAAPNVMWSEDGTGFGSPDRKKELLVLQDECSRYKVNHRLVEGPACGDDVVDYLREAFNRHGAPLVLKQDSEAKLNDIKVKELLKEYGVTLLNGPTYYPKYNGKIERGMRDIKQYVKGMSKYGPRCPLIKRIDTAVDDLNNLRPRPVLKGKTSEEVFNHCEKRLPDRYKFKREVKIREAELKESAQNRRQERSARRRAIEEVLLRYGLIKNHADVSTNYRTDLWTY